jgi:hypothetical protein
VGAVRPGEEGVTEHRGEHPGQAQPIGRQPNPGLWAALTGVDSKHLDQQRPAHRCSLLANRFTRVREYAHRLRSEAEKPTIFE